MMPSQMKLLSADLELSHQAPRHLGLEEMSSLIASPPPEQKSSHSHVNLGLNQVTSEESKAWVHTPSVSA